MAARAPRAGPPAPVPWLRLVLRLYAEGLYELESWIVSQGPAAHVLDPESLRREIVAELRAVLATYNEKA